MELNNNILNNLTEDETNLIIDSLTDSENFKHLYSKYRIICQQLKAEPVPITTDLIKIKGYDIKNQSWVWISSSFEESENYTNILKAYKHILRNRNINNIIFDKTVSE